MLIKDIHIRGIRNLEDLALTFGPGMNLITGENGQGKTSVLESIWLLCTLQSFRTAKLPDAITQGASSAEVSGTVSYPGAFERHNRVALELTASNRLKKTAYVDQKFTPKRSNYVHQNLGSQSFSQPCVVFHPQDHKLIDGEPALRRTYVDQMLFQMKADYAARYMRYTRALTQRNTLLKGEKTPKTQSLVDEFQRLLVDDGSHLLYERLEWEKRFIPEVKRRLTETLKTPFELDLRWKLSLLQGAKDNRVFDRLKDSNSVQSWKTFWEEKQPEVASLEWTLKSTILGPHRDDYSILSFHRPLKETGSQGEKRTVILGMKMAEVALFESQKHSEKPVLLVDDFSSELDQEKRTKFLDYMRATDLQVIITSTEALLPHGNVIRLRRGKAW